MTFSAAEGTAPLGAVASHRRRRGAAVESVALTLRSRAPGALQGVFVLAAAALWISSVQHVDIRRIGDLGLVSALSPGAFAALAGATASFAVTLRHKEVSTPLAVLHLVVLVFMLYGATSLIDSEPASNVVWRHAGVTDYVLTTGRVDPGFDAYLNWPGFFLLAALAARAAGVSSALGLAPWAPVAFELMYLPALVVIARAFTSDRRLAWTAVWIFYLTNWVGQDYLSPQAMGYVLYLALVAVVLTCLSRTAAPDLPRLRERGARLLVRLRVRRPGGPLSEVGPAATVVSPAQRAALVLVCVVLIAATVASDQLTPWMMLSGLVALVGLRRCTARGFPVITAALLLAWMSYLAAAHLDGHLKLLGQTLDVHQTVSAHASGRVAAGGSHQAAVWIRLEMIALLCALAVGAVRGLRRGEGSPSHAILAAAPAALALLQPYGGEVLMRVYLFSLPFAACYAARALMPSPHWRGWRVSAVLAAASALLVAGFLFTRYANERAVLFTAGEVQAVDRLYDIAPRGSLLVAASPNVPWQQRRYGDYRYKLLPRQLKVRGAPPTPDRLAALVAGSMGGSTTGGAYLLLTRSQGVDDAALEAPKWASTTELERAVERSLLFSKVFDDGDGKIFVLRLRDGIRRS